ncbi:MAG: hypothetical protein KatS3mg068_1098 [Candidatus Sericytochromatia bacterium]|nr:MAG: hypothetical protein KatS3mg068_1098 [Candidatus Sericytochromatia bacterium]
MKNKVLTFLGIFLLTLNNIEVKKANAQIQNNNINVKGKIIDKETKKPIKNVYIKQVDTLNTKLTDDEGNFNIELQKNAKMELIIFKEGYEKIQFKVENKNYFEIELVPAIKINVDLPQPHTKIDDIFNYSSKPISSMFSAMYQVRNILNSYPSLNDNNNVLNTNGWAINELSIDGKIRLDNWLGAIRIFRSRSPIDINNFDYKPVYYLDTLQFQTSANKVFNISDKLEILGGLTYLIHFSTPDNKGGGDNKPIPYTNSYMDFPHNRQGLGLASGIGYKFTEKILFLGNVNLYPYLFMFFDSLKTSTINYLGMLDTNLSLKFETLDGVYVSIGYNYQLFFGNNNFKDTSNMFNVGVSLDPFKMANVQPLGTESLSNKK